MKLKPKFHQRIRAGGKLARKKEINFELKFCAKFYLELSKMDAFLTAFYV